MTNQELLDLLDFDAEIKSVEVIREEPLDFGATFVLANLHYEFGDIKVPFVHYSGKDWLFTPSDWQSPLLDKAESLEDITWRVNDTNVRAIIYYGQPILAPTAPADFDNANRKKRKEVGILFRETREKAGISAQELADRSGVSRGTICRLETGRMNSTIDTFNTLAQTLGVEMRITLG